MKNLFCMNYWGTKVLALLVLVVMGGSVKGQVNIVKFDPSTLTGGAGNWGASPLTPTTSDANVTIVGLTRGSGVGTPGTSTAAGKAWGGTAINTNTTQATAISSDNTVTFSITPNSGYKISLTQIPAYNIRRSSSGFTTGIWQYSVNGGTFTDIGSVITWGSTTNATGNIQSAINLSGIAALQNVNTIIALRVVLWSASGTGTWYFNNQTSGTYDLIVTGTVDLNPINYYSKPTGNLNEVAYWGTSTDGSGTAPSNFTTANQYFNVRNNATPTIGADWTISGSNTKLIIDNGSTLTIPLTRTLNISSTSTIENSGNITNNGTLTLKSDANGTASIGNSAGTITGNITVERYIPANRKYRFLASPVVGATAANWRNNGTNTAGIGTHITGGIPANNFDQSTLNAPSAFWYNEVNAGSLTDVGSGASNDPGWSAFADGNLEPLTNGKGFRIFVRGDRTLSLTGSIPTANNTTLSVTGTYPGASVSIATTKTNSNTNSGFNLVGNPYPATIDWNTVTKGTGISATYSTFNPSANAYVQWNGSTGDATQYIASGQAFFVQQLTGTTSSITIAEANKVSNAAGNFFRYKLADHLKISMKYDSANYDAAFIHFREDAQNNFDTYDGLKFQNAGVNIASVGTDGKRYNINSLASLTETKEIPLSVLGSVLTNFELKFEDVSSFQNHKVYMIDHYLNKMLLLSNGFTYPIALSSDSASVKDGRFKIVFVQKATGIDPNIKNANAFILYPNPAADVIHLLLDAKNTTNKNVAFEIYNQLGALMQQGKLDFTAAKDQTIAIDQLAQGSYFIKLHDQAQNQIIKFIK